MRPKRQQNICFTVFLSDHCYFILIISPKKFIRKTNGRKAAPNVCVLLY